MVGTVTTAWARIDKELIALCPIDGPLAAQHRPVERGAAELEREVRELVATLRDEGEHNWATMVERATNRPTQRDILTGHALAILLRRGPWHRGSLRARRIAVEQLLVDIVARWPAGQPR